MQFSNDIRSFLAWKEQMSQDVCKQNVGVNAMHIVAPSQGTVDQGSISQLSLNQSCNDDGLPTVWYLEENNELAETVLAPVDPSMLRYDQFHAYDIVTWHLDQTLAGRKPPPLRMLIHGEGSTGKSKVIQTITEYFVSKSMRHTLLKAAYTGVAASLIDSKTTHSIAMISHSDDATASNETRGKLQVSWRCILYLIIDEMSMISKEFLAKLSRNISIGKMVEGQPASNYSFGGISIIMCGDFHQFPPVSVSPHEALYFPSKPHDSASSKLGRATYEEFNTVVVLKEQMQVTYEVWHDFLQHLHYGHVQEYHTEMLHTLLITRHDTQTDLSTEPWNDSSLVTPRHAVRRLWNEATLKKHAQESQKFIFQCHAEDRIKGQPLTLAEHYAAAIRGSGQGQQRHQKQDLPDAIEITIGMKVMVTQNVQTDLDITNGACSTIVDIILSPEEPVVSQLHTTIKLQHVPLYVLVKLSQT